MLPLLFSTPPQATCPAQGTPLLEMRQRSELGTPTTTTRVFSSGAWTVESQGRSRSGCFERAELRAIRKAVQRAPWQTATSPIACFAYDPNFTEYVVRGRLRFTERMCSGKTADFQTLQAIDLVKQELAEDHATLPPVEPPAAGCRVAGTPVFEIRKRSHEAEATSTMALYASGAWTFQPIDEHGRAGALTTGCLDKPTTASLRTTIARSPWDTTFSRIVCKAYSPSFTQYYVHGRLEYTARLCGAERLDATSLAALTRIEGTLAKALPAQPADTACH